MGRGRRLLPGGVRANALERQLHAGMPHDSAGEPGHAARGTYRAIRRASAALRLLHGSAWADWTFLDRHGAIAGTRTRRRPGTSPAPVRRPPRAESVARRPAAGPA